MYVRTQSVPSHYRLRYRSRTAGAIDRRSNRARHVRHSKCYSIDDTPTAFRCGRLRLCGESVLTNKLVSYINQNVQGVDAVAALSAGATNIRKVIPAEYLHVVLQAYNNALTQVFEMVLVMACLTTIGSVALE